MKLEAPVENVTPDPPAVRVVMPVIAPPVVTPSTVIPAPVAVMFKVVPTVRKPSSALSRAKPPIASPNDTAVAAALVMLMDPPVEMAPVIARSAATMVRF